METKKLTTEGLYRLHTAYLTDPVRQSILNKKYEILSQSIPTFILNTETNEIEPRYLSQIQYALDKLDEQLADYTEANYKELMEFSKPNIELAEKECTEAYENGKCQAWYKDVYLSNRDANRTHCIQVKDLNVYTIGLSSFESKRAVYYSYYREIVKVGVNEINYAPSHAVREHQNCFVCDGVVYPFEVVRFIESNGIRLTPIY